jgi:hypothetical protein
MNKSIDKILGNIFDFLSFFAAAIFVCAIIAIIMVIVCKVIEILILTPEMMRAVIKR